MATRLNKVRSSHARLARGEEGFTLIELLTVIGIIGVLSALSLTGFTLYRASAAYAVASSTLRSARNAVEAALSDPDNPPAAVVAQSQSASGPIQNPSGNQLLPGMQVPKNMTIQYAYDPTCLDVTCPYEVFLQANHCAAKEYTRWIRFGDGVEILLEHVAGAGC